VALVAPAVIGLAIVALVLARHRNGLGGRVLLSMIVVSWAVAGALLARRRPAEPMGAVVLASAVLAAIAGAAAIAGPSSSSLGEPRPFGASVVMVLALALLPAAGMHLLLGAPDGVLRRSARWAVVVGYSVASAVGLITLAARSILPAVVTGEALLALGVGIPSVQARYRRTSERQARHRMLLLAFAALVAVEATAIALALRLAVAVPLGGPQLAAVMAVPLAAGLAASAFPHAVAAGERLVVAALPLVGLTGVVFGVYLAIVLGLGRIPTPGERKLLGLSMLAAGATAVLYPLAQARLTGFSGRVMHGERHVREEALRSFGTHLSRSVPLDELILQMAELLQRVLGLSSAEVWTGSGGLLDRSVSVPDRGSAHLALAAVEAPVVTGAGVSGRAWAEVWLADLVVGRPEAPLRVAPISHSGELLGLIVVERPPEGEPFEDEDDRLLAELSRQLALALHNVRLDSALQASLEEVRRQARELQESRARIVSAADATRRSIERNLHDGAQQHLVALAVKIRLARQLAEIDLDQAKSMLDELRGDLQEAVQELRSLAHGIYPPLLVERGLGEALAAAAGRAAIPTDVSIEDVGRHPPEVEAAVYFCCVEALQNAGKHAGEQATAVVRVWHESGGLLFEVADDGLGFDQGAKGTGAGFVNMSDRLGAIGGVVRVDSSPGAGTRVSGVIPVTREAAQGPAGAPPTIVA
jgi:signal transduction histidine kinase